MLCCVLFRIGKRFYLDAFIIAYAKILFTNIFAEWCSGMGARWDGKLGEKKEQLEEQNGKILTPHDRVDIMLYFFLLPEIS